MQDFEKLGAFYLGRQHDLQQGITLPDPLLYDAKDLTTHAVCVGMTGSGKTGLCVSLLEEAAIDGIPAIVIDPKGDLGNLLLTFPNLLPADFRPWVDDAEAARNGMTSDEFATATAKLWREGLAEWGQDGARIAKLRDAAETVLYTPGSSAGIPLSPMRSFAAPSPTVLVDADALRECVTSAAAGLLVLLGLDPDPIRSREHILLSNLFDRAWRAGRSLDIAALIREIQAPPFDKIGVMDLDTFFPAADRFAMSMRLNNLIASPSFSSWLEGEPLDIQRLLYTDQGKPKLSVISISHLSDAERMFFVTILLNAVLSWVRSQPGSSSLRALLYMDEVFGYFPPTANPPCKRPMLTLLKQARAYGLGIVLATQNPVDLDYKGLSNAGTWFLGRLQTERDKARVLEGLEGAAVSSGMKFDRQTLEATLAGLGSRVFLMNNVHDDEPVVFKTRWALSYLRGPLTRPQIQQLMAPHKTATAASAATLAPSAPSHATSPTLPPSTMGQVVANHEPPTSRPANAVADAVQRPIVPPEAREAFVARTQSTSPGDRLVYRPAVLGVARLHFVHSKSGIDQWEPTVLLRPILDDTTTSLWEDADVLTEGEPPTLAAPESGIEFSSLPAVFTNARKYKSWAAKLKSVLYQQQTLDVWHCEEFKMYSAPGQSQADFRAALQHAVREKRDLEIAKLRDRYASKLTTLKDRLRRAQERVDRETSQYRQSQYQSVISFGTSLLGALFGRKLASRTNVSRAGTAMRSAGRTAQQHSDIGRAEQGVEDINDKLAEMEAQFADDTRQLEDSLDVGQLEIEVCEIRPRKSDISVEKVALVWTPWTVDAAGIAQPAF